MVRKFRSSAVCSFFAQRSTDERGTVFPRLRRLLSHAARGEAEAASANTANSFILMTLLTSAEQRSRSDGSYHSRGWEKGRSSPLPLSSLWQPPPPQPPLTPPPLGCIPKLSTDAVLNLLPPALVRGASIPDSEAATPINLAALARALMKRLYKLAARDGESEFLMRTPPC